MVAHDNSGLWEPLLPGWFTSYFVHAPSKPARADNYYTRINFNHAVRTAAEDRPIGGLGLSHCDTPALVAAGRFVRCI